MFTMCSAVQTIASKTNTQLNQNVFTVCTHLHRWQIYYKYVVVACLNKFSTIYSICYIEVKLYNTNTKLAVEG